MNKIISFNLMLASCIASACGHDRGQDGTRTINVTNNMSYPILVTASEHECTGSIEFSVPAGEEGKKDMPFHCGAKNSDEDEEPLAYIQLGWETVYESTVHELALAPFIADQLTDETTVVMLLPDGSKLEKEWGTLSITEPFTLRVEGETVTVRAPTPEGEAWIGIPKSLSNVQFPKPVGSYEQGDTVYLKLQKKDLKKKMTFNYKAMGNVTVICSDQHGCSAEGK